MKKIFIFLLLITNLICLSLASDSDSPLKTHKMIISSEGPFVSPSIKEVRETLAILMQDPEKYKGMDIFDLNPNWDPSPESVERIFRAYISLDKEEQEGKKPVSEGLPTLEDSRRMFKNSLIELSFLKAPEATVLKDEFSLNTSKFVCYTQGSKTEKILLHLHGGGYILRYEDTGGLYEDMFAKIVKKADCDVLVPLYRTRPEHPLEASLEDAYAAYMSLVNQGYSPGNIILSGDSAGGGLALRLLLKLKETNGPMPSKAILLSPWTDLTLSSPSFKENAGADMFSDTTGLEDFTKMVVGDNDAKSPLVSPVYGDYTRFPPLVYVVATPEIFRDDTLRDVTKARLQGVEVRLIQHDDGVHVYPGSARFLKSGKEALDQIIKEIKK